MNKMTDWVGPVSGHREAVIGGERQPLLSLVNVSRTFPGVIPIEALGQCSLDVHSGEMAAVAGRSGSGKSTLLNILGLLDRPSTGRYAIGGIETTSLTDREITSLRAEVIGFVFQSFHLISYRTAVENVEVGMLYDQVDTSTRRERAREALDVVGLQHRADQLPDRLSGGERQRVAIARALARRNQVLLCDEPTGNLDSVTTTEVMDLLARLNAEQGVTVIIITHDDEVAGRCRRHLALSDGRLQSGGDRDE